MGRFLIFFSYLGTRYSGVQRQNLIRKGQPIHTVERVLQEAFKALRPANDARIVLSSRTDKGVHALKNACHVDLVYPDVGQEYEPAVITNVLNYHLKRREEDVRVLQTRRVSDTFHSRLQAKGRKYVYRLGHVVKPEGNLDLTDPESNSILEQLKKFAPRPGSRGMLPRLPVGDQLSTFDMSKAVVFRYKLDIDKLVAAAEVVSGIHNFLSFTTKRKDDAAYLPHPCKMLTIGVKRGQPMGHQLQKLGCDMAENIEFWDIHVQSRSFLYKQVRRVVGAMVLVARDIITLDDLRDILDNPRKEFPFSGRMGMNEDGLFLVDVEYNPQDLEFSEASATRFVPSTEEHEDYSEELTDDKSPSEDEDNEVDNTDNTTSSDSEDQPAHGKEKFTLRDFRKSVKSTKPS